MVPAADDRRIEREPETTMATTGTRTLLRTSILGAAVAALLAVSLGDAGANQSGPDVNATVQVQFCRALGGTAHLYTTRTVTAGLSSANVYCEGSLFGDFA